MVTDEEVLNFFRTELPVVKSLLMKPVTLSLDSFLQEYAEIDDLAPTIDKYSVEFNTDISSLHIDQYLPWIIPWFFRSWFTKRPVKQLKRPLTVRMFAESARAGRWLYE